LPLFIRYCLIVGSFYLVSCDTPDQKHHQKRRDYIRKIPGKSYRIPSTITQKGEVLIAYSDCYTCHKEDKEAVGPAFKDIAERYPVQRVYIDMLAQKVISGGSGAWGSATMSAHPQVSMAEAKFMVSYILSLKKE
jgi:cytochrome c